MTDAHCHASCGEASVRELLVGRDFVGVHPWDVEKWKSGKVERWGSEEVEAWLRGRLAEDPRLGVGEIGLDRLRERTIPTRMREVFEAQLRVALEFGRPVVLHGAKCWGEVVRVIVELKRQLKSKPQAVQRGGIGDAALPVHNGRGASPMRPQRVLQLPPEGKKPASPSCPLSPLCPFLFHGFSRSGGLLPQIVALNGYVSVGPAVLNDHAVNYRELVKAIPLDRLLVETDRDCAPEELLNPQTGKPLSVRDVLAKTAELRGLSPAELEAATDANAMRFMGLEA